MTTENIIKSLNLTDSAAHRIASVISSEKKSQFRVYVTGGGCSGFQYGFKFDDEIAFDDEVIDYKDFSVLLDSLSYPYLYGSISSQSTLYALDKCPSFHSDSDRTSIITALLKSEEIFIETTILITKSNFII